MDSDRLWWLSRFLMGFKEMPAAVQEHLRRCGMHVEDCFICTLVRSKIEKETPLTGRMHRSQPAMWSIDRHGKPIRYPRD